MLKHYIKIAIRYLLHQAGISFINIFGLTIGMACAMLIFLWVNNQLSYDKNQVNRDRIYRLETETWVVLPPYLRETAAVFPEVEQSVRFYFWYEPVLRYDENQFTVPDCALVDSNVFRVFNFDFILGNPETALNAPQSIVLTRSVATRLFGKENPMGKMLLMDNDYEYTVTGVVDDITDLHLEINIFVSVSDMARRPGNEDFLVSRNYNFPTYLLVHPETDITALAAKINTRARDEDDYSSAPLFLRPLRNIYFAKNLQHESNTKHGNAGMVIIFSIIALLILIIASINFINLSLAKTAVREREIAVRKVSGAGKRTVMLQYLGESFLIVFIAFLFAVILTKCLLPGFNYLTGAEIRSDFNDFRFITIFLGILIFSVASSGLLPSLYVSSLSPAKIFKGEFGAEGNKHIFSKILITFQFVVSIILIISALTVLQQYKYMQSADLGIDLQKVVCFTLQGEKLQGSNEEVLSSKLAFKEQLLNNPLIRGVTFVNQVPGWITSTWTLSIDENDENGIPFKVINADPDFVNLMGLEIIDGRNFSFDTQTDMGLKFIINQEAAKQLQLNNPPGSTLQSGMIEIIGVIKNFHFNSLHSKIEPMAIRWNNWTQKACVKISAANIPESVEYIRSVFQDFCPGYVFEYDFLHESYARQYLSEQRLGKILTCIVLIAVCLSYLGLFALSIFVVQQRTNEIGIRKVFGSTISNVILLISGRFILLVIIATVISWPMAWIVLQKWLDNYPYHINLDFMVFLGSGILAVLVTFIAVGVQSISAAMANPANSLRYE